MTKVKSSLLFYTVCVKEKTHSESCNFVIMLNFDSKSVLTCDCDNETITVLFSLNILIFFLSQLRTHILNTPSHGGTLQC